MAVALHLIVLICYFATAMSAIAGYRPLLDLNPTRSLTCTINNKTGMCVDNSICNDAHVIELGGVIDESEFRDKRQCPEQSDWCCTSEVIPPPEIGSSNTDECFALENDVCPWCVLLYNTVDVKQKADRPFCLGALIGSSVIVTASTCLKAARNKVVYAQVPNSANPGIRYTVIRRQFHPNYNSGSHEYDFGIVVIDGNVTFSEGKARGACVDFQDQFEGDCVGYGFDSRGEITSTILNVKKNSCGKNGSSKDAACGMNIDRVCIIAPGGPVLCPNKNRFFLLGIARGICETDDNVLLGAISHSKAWIETELSAMKIPKDVYSRDNQGPDFVYKNKKGGYG